MLPTVSPPQTLSPYRHIFYVLAALFAAFELYGPTLHAPFLFDDKVLPFAAPQFEHAPLSAWISGTRPVLMFSYWLNFTLAGPNTGSFHNVNILLHAANSLLVYAVLRHFVPARWPAALLAAVFLVHPLQTESVSYIAGRSESLSAFFFLAAYVVFLRRPEGAVTWARSAAIIAFYVAAILSKEHTVVLPALLLLTDAFHSPNNIRRNWRLYIPMAVSALAGLAMVARVLAMSKSAGFNTSGATWYQYALTQTRAIFQYLRLTLLPVGQSVDHDFPISHSVTEHHTWLFLTSLVLLTGAAFYFRRRFPLAAFGFFAFLLLLAPTSSIIPINDPLAERRMYLPLLALLLVSAQAIPRFRVPIPTAIALAVLAIFSILTYQRNVVWSHPIAFWLDTVRNTPQKGRPYSHLADAAVSENSCADIAPFLDDARTRLPDDYYVLTGYARILECVGRPTEAAGLLQRAAQVRPSAEVFELLGLLYGEMKDKEASREALESALRLNPNSVSAHMAMALWYQAADDLTNAAKAYKRVLEIEPYHGAARSALRAIEFNLTAGP
ncbi:MAG: tetratricopeptide repeat protein [Bryobacteraceae bacterium]